MKKENKQLKQNNALHHSWRILFFVLFRCLFIRLFIILWLFRAEYQNAIVYNFKIETLVSIQTVYKTFINYYVLAINNKMRMRFKKKARVKTHFCDVSKEWRIRPVGGRNATSSASKNISGKKIICIKEENEKQIKLYLKQRYCNLIYNYYESRKEKPLLWL